MEEVNNGPVISEIKLENNLFSLECNEINQVYENGYNSIQNGDFKVEMDYFDGVEENIIKTIDDSSVIDNNITKSHTNLNDENEVNQNLEIVKESNDDSLVAQVTTEHKNDEFDEKTSVNEPSELKQNMDNKESMETEEVIKENEIAECTDEDITVIYEKPKEQEVANGKNVCVVDKKQSKKKGRKKLINKTRNINKGSNATRKTLSVVREYGCPICNKEFGSERARLNHVSTFHSTTKYGIHCLESGCNFSCGFTFLLQNHLSEVHKIPMKYLNYEFNTVQDFEAWKYAYEKQESCRFIKKSGYKLKSGGKVSGYLYCSRSGKFVSRSTGKKRMRKIGSSKICGHCTASVKYYEDSSSGKIKAIVCSTHYGHQNDYRYLRIAGDDRKAIIEKIKLGIPRDVIVDTVRSSCGVDRPDRLHLLSIKDLDNIERANKITTKPTSINNGRRTLSTKFTDEWVEGLSRVDDDNTSNSVLYYKRKDSNASDTYLDKPEDECIVLMTNGQAEICSKLVDRCPVVILYATVLLLPHLRNFYLTSLLMVDEFRSTFPIAFMICNRRDDPAMKLFFGKLKEKQPSVGKAKIFATDNLEYIYKSWTSIFDNNDDCRHIWSNRYVDEEWRDYLSIIEDERLQMNVYDEIYRFVESADDSYKEGLAEVIQRISDNAECSEFGKYLSRYFLDNVRLWATCYLKDATGIDEPIDFDTTYNRIRDTFEYGNIRQLKHVGKSAQELIKLMVDFHLERDRRTNTLTVEIRKTHDMNAVNDMLNVFPFRKGTWKIAAPGTSNDVTNPETVTENSCVYGENCSLRCDRCRVCVHRFKCSCDYYVTNRVCKHIHLLASSLSKLRKTLPPSSSVINRNDSTNNKVPQSPSDDNNSVIITTMTESNSSHDDIIDDEKRRSDRKIKLKRLTLSRRTFINTSKINIRRKLNYLRKITFALKKQSSLFQMHDCVLDCLGRAENILRVDRRCKGFPRNAYIAAKRRLHSLENLLVVKSTGHSAPPVTLKTYGKYKLTANRSSIAVVG